MKNTKLKGFSVIKLLVFLASCALIYFFVWPAVRDWYYESQYEKMNNGARMVYEAAESYCEGKNPNEVESVYCRIIGKWDGNVTDITDQINNRMTSEFSDYYYTVIIKGGKVEAAYVAETTDSKIVGSYPDESTLSSHTYEKLPDEEN